MTARPKPAPVEVDLFELAVDLARRAGDITLRWFRDARVTIEQKADRSPVTEADRATERFIRAELGRLYPMDAVVGEEEGGSTGTSERRWFVDPIDGTRAFLRGVPLYSTLLAVSDAYGPAIGVIHMPALGETVAAGRGLGCFSNGTPARVSDQAVLADALLTTSGFDEWPETMLTSVHRAGCRLRTWGDGYGYALVATGRADAMVDPFASPWDVAPMPIVLAEAGGRFTMIDGTEGVDGSAGVDQVSGVATNGRIHDALLAALA